MSGQVTVHYDCWWQDPVEHHGDVRDIRHHSVNYYSVGGRTPLNIAVMLVTFAITLLVLVTWESNDNNPR